ncbi:uncharacterized protein LOC129618922 [Condylostylus longicornis]|uniref:uncharacterized protein LOC129618922 n=1 Tax=Condylostylus longicornis TaxID=2530218 RepID=UPI00244DDEAE|nr:uncharacterized protein LOC129618922 [Condylostylus longicornis]
MMFQKKFFFLLLTLFKFIGGQEDGTVLKICAPSVSRKECKDLLPLIEEHGPQVECVFGHPRVECLEMLQKNEADVVAVTPEDAFFATTIDKDNTFRIIAELRTEEYDIFEDEDQVLVKVSSNIKSFKDLKGSKSCHPNFNSYYGYKIPISILYKLGLLEISKDPSIPRPERELKALSDFFNQSCLVGPYSDDENINEEWKKKYSNLCQLCENPAKCNHNDNYANYYDSIECLVHGGGDVAFTRRSDIRRYFGIVGEDGNKDVDINDYELLCEDGSRRPINGTGCSLAKRPNAAYVTTTNITNNPKLLNSLLVHLKTFFKNGLERTSAKITKNFLIEDEMKLYTEPVPVSLQDYTKELKVYYQRNESYTFKVKFCVMTELELEKCEILSKLSLFYEIRPLIECYLSRQNDCAAEVASDNADIAVVPGYNWAIVDHKYKNLKPVEYENWIFNETYIAIVDGYQTIENILKYPIKFDNSDKRAYKAACLLHLILGGEDDCENLNGNISETNDYIQIINATQRHRYGRNKVLLCLDKTLSHLGDYYSCNLDNYYQNAIYASKNKSGEEISSYKNLITTIGSLFADDGAHASVFDIYGPFKGKRDVLINACTLDFIDGLPNFKTIEEKHLKICAPERLIEDCKDLLDRVKQNDPKIDCISGRDRIDCLEMLQNNEADVVAVEHEDVYLAAEMDKTAFRIIAELRHEKDDTAEEEDQILIKKSSTIKGLKDLKGLKSCHPNFNSYYGYKIPVVILKRHGLLNVSKDPTIPALERELQALSEFFEQSCIVGPYSNDENIDQEWKKKYPNLCQICDNPVECDENDKYANFNGSIECLINGEGDVAFTTREDIRQYFGLTDEKGNTDVNINDYELLCEDGSRQSINGTGCSLARRPNRAYITTTKITNNSKLLNNLLSHLKIFFKNGLEHGNSKVAKNMLIEEEMIFYQLSDVLTLEEYLIGSKDYIERDESYTYKAKLCVNTETEFEKCKILTKVSFVSEIRPELECYLSGNGNCAADVANDKAHIAIIPGYNWTTVEKEFSNLKKIAYENWNFEKSYIALINVLPKNKDLQKYSIKFDNSDKRAHKAACLLNLILKGSKDCKKLDGSVNESNPYIHIVKAADRHNHGKDKGLLCLNKSISRIGKYYSCNLDLYYQNAIYVNRNKSKAELESYEAVFNIIGIMFGYNGLYSNVFDVFEQFKGNNDVLFNDYTMNFEGTKNFDDFEEKYHDLIMELLKYNW